MATQMELLEILASMEEPAKASDLAKVVKAGEGSVRTWLNRLKDNGYVDGSGHWKKATEAKPAGHPMLCRKAALF